MVSQITILCVVSLIFALIFKSLGQPYLLGYICTGLVLGPIFSHTTLYSQLVYVLGNFGLLMLIFHIGIEFDLKDFKKLWKKALCIFALQLFVFSLFGYCLLWLGYSLSFALMSCFLLQLSSTAVVVKLLEEMDELEEEDESLIVSILIFQDLAIVPMTIILNSLKEACVFSIIWKVFLSIIGLIVLIWFLSNTSSAVKREKILKPLNWIFDGNQEIMTLASLAMCFSFSTLSEFLGLSHSYGPFLAGLILGSLGSGSKKEVLAVSNPIGSILMMSFFIYVGLNIDVEFIQAHYSHIIYLTIIIFLLKIIVNYLVLRLLSFNKVKSFYISIILSQASEFSFSFLAILLANGALNEYNFKLISSLCIISLTLGSVFPILAQSMKRFYEKVN